MIYHAEMEGRVVKQWFVMGSACRFMALAGLLCLALLLSGCGTTYISAPDYGGRYDTSSLGARVAQTARSQIGAHYRLGGTTPKGFDCSGLIWWAYRQHGINVPRVPAAQAPAYTAPAAQPVPESAPVQQAAQVPAMQETAYYEPPTAQPVPEPTESAQAQGEKVATVEFAIAPHPEEPEEAEPAPIPVEEPAIDETRFQDVSGLYDEPEAKPARRRKAGTTRRTTRKKASDEPQEELNSPAFDNFEGVDFDS